MIMKISKIRTLYFSGTKTTEKIVTALTENLSASLNITHTYVNFSNPDVRLSDITFAPDELVIIGVPVYAGRVPNVLLPYLTKKLHGQNTPVIPVVLYGNRNFDDALMELKNIMTDNGFFPIAAAAFIGEHSFSKILASNRPDDNDMKILDAFSEDVSKKISALDIRTAAPVNVRGCDPIRPYYTPRDRFGTPINILKVKPLTNTDVCVKCGKCAELCPMGSIDKNDVSLVSGICIKCCACVKLCPVGAKYYTDEGYLYHQHELEDQFSRRAEPELFL